VYNYITNKLHGMHGCASEVKDMAACMFHLTTLCVPPPAVFNAVTPSHGEMHAHFYFKLAVRGYRHAIKLGSDTQCLLMVWERVE
jgi:hypothetical protein